MARVTASGVAGSRNACLRNRLLLPQAFLHSIDSNKGFFFVHTKSFPTPRSVDPINKGKRMSVDSPRRFLRVENEISRTLADRTNVDFSCS